MIIDIGKIESWNPSNHSGTVRSEATHKNYTVDKKAFGRIPREPHQGDSVIIDRLDSQGVNRIAAARIRGLEPQKSSAGTVLLLLLLITLAVFLWKSGILSSLKPIQTESPTKMETPSPLNR